MKIGIIGAGNIGGSLGKLWAAKGHKIVFGVRDVNSPKTQKALAELGDVRAVSIAEAAAWGEAIEFAVPWGAAEETVKAMGDVAGKIIIDSTNRFDVSEDRISGAEEIAKWSNGGRVVKAFNAMGYDTLLNPIFSGQRATTFIAGDDAEAKVTVTRLADDIGLLVTDVGPLASAGMVESLGRMWVSMMRGGAGRDFAFTLIKR